MNQKKKNIILIFVAFLMFSIYIWKDQKIRSRFENRKQEYILLNQELSMGNSEIGEIQDLRKRFMENQEKLNLKKISGDELLQEVERLKSLASSMDMSLIKLTIDPRNTFPTTKDLFKNKAVLSLSISDLFNTRYMRFDSYGTNFMQYTQFKRDSQFLICSLIYCKILCSPSPGVFALEYIYFTLFIL